MVEKNVIICPRCGGDLQYRDSVNRIVRTKRRSTTYIRIRRVRCASCHAIHREIPEEIFPFKQYEREVIIGVIEGLITSDTIGFEEYPTEQTMNKWKNMEVRIV